MAMPTVEEVSAPAVNVPEADDVAVLPDPNVVAAPALPSVPTQVGVTHLGHEVVAHPSGDLTVHDAGFSAKRGLPVDPNGKALVDSHFGHTQLAPLIRGPVVDARSAPKEPVQTTMGTAKDVLNGARKQAASLPLTPAEEQATGEHPYAATAVATPLALGPMAVDAVTDKFKTTQQLNADKVANTKEPVVVRVKADGTSDDTDIVPVQKEAPKPIEPALVGTTKDNQEIIRSADGKPVVVPAGTAGKMKLATDPEGTGWLQKHAPSLAALVNPVVDAVAAGAKKGQAGQEGLLDENHPTADNVGRFMGGVVRDAGSLGTVEDGAGKGGTDINGKPIYAGDPRKDPAWNTPGWSKVAQLFGGGAAPTPAAAADPKIVAALGDKLASEKSALVQPVFAPGTQPVAGGSVSVSTKSATRPGASASGPDESAFKGRMAQNENIRQEENAAAKAEVDAQNAADKSKAEGLENRAYGAEQYSQMDKANLDQYQKEAAATSAKYLKVADELVNSKIDRHKLFKDVAERGNTMQLVIGSLLYGFGAGGLGQDPDIISKLVNQNVADQETDLANHAKGGEMYNTHLGQLANQLKDKNNAVEALRGAFYKQAGDMLDAAALRAGIPANDAKLLRAKAVTDRGFLDAEQKIQTNVLNDAQSRATTQGIKTDTALKGQDYQMKQDAINFRHDHPGYLPGQISATIYGQQVPIPFTNGDPKQQAEVKAKLQPVYQAHQTINTSVDNAIKILKEHPDWSAFESSTDGKKLLNNILSSVESLRAAQGAQTVPTSELFDAIKKSLSNGILNNSKGVIENWEQFRNTENEAADSIATFNGLPPFTAMRQSYMATQNSPTAQYGRK